MAKKMAMEAMHQTHTMEVLGVRGSRDRRARQELPGQRLRRLRQVARIGQSWTGPSGSGMVEDMLTAGERRVARRQRWSSNSP